MTRGLDVLGRIVIPKEIRKELEWNTGDKIIIEQKGEKLLLRKNKIKECKYCGTNQPVKYNFCYRCGAKLGKEENK